jgi:hypothetical protein
MLRSQTIALAAATCAALAQASLVDCACAQHLDILVQSVDGRLVTGATDFDVPVGMPPVTTLGVRVYAQTFDSLFAVDEPGFNSVGATTGTVPPGAEPLPGDLELMWDFLPMNAGAVASNLLYWDGAGTPPDGVSFGLPPSADYSLSLFGENDVRVAADGTDRLIPGSVVDTTAADGFIHEHRFFFLDNDHDDNNATVAAAGVYLVAMRLRMETLDRSDPFYLVWSTPGVSLGVLQEAAEWTESRVDQLAPSFSADFDGDLDVDGADFLTWQRGLGAADARQIQGDATGDHKVDVNDLEALQIEFNSPPAGADDARSARAPEPAAAALIVTAVAATTIARGRGRALANGRPL